MKTNGYDYENQAWVKQGLYVRCGHLDDDPCDCYGRLHAGEPCEKTAEELNGFYSESSDTKGAAQ